MSAAPVAVFAFGSDDAADLLANAACVTRFVCDAADSLHGQGEGVGLSADGAGGLFYILSTVENTIKEALNRL